MFPRLHSMHFFRLNRIHRSVSTIVLLFGLFIQLQTVFACDLIEDQVGAICCCEAQMAKGCSSGGGCEGNGSNSATDCCQTSLSVETVDVVADASREVITRFLDPVQTTALIAPLLIKLDSSPTTTVSMVKPNHDAHWQFGTGTYLATLRIRI